MTTNHLQEKKSTGWVGWIVFAATMMLVVGFFNIIDGLVALFADDVFVVGDSGVYLFNLDAWGWWHMLFGVVLIASGVALFNGSRLARLVAVVLVVVNAVTHAAFLPAYPLWSTLIIAVDVLILWALIVHGDESVTG